LLAALLLTRPLTVRLASRSLRTCSLSPSGLLAARPTFGGRPVRLTPEQSNHDVAFFVLPGHPIDAPRCKTALVLDGLRCGAVEPIRPLGVRQGDPSIAVARYRNGNVHLFVGHRVRPLVFGAVFDANAML